MTRRLRRGGAALLALALPLGLSACGAGMGDGSGFDAETRLVEADNAAGQTPAATVLTRAVVLVKSANATAAALAGTIINRGDKPDVLDTIEIVPVRGAQPITLKPNITLNPGQVLALGTEAAEPLTVADGGALKVGHFALVTMRFRTSGEIAMEVPVEIRDRYYSSVVPATGTTTTQADRKLANACVTNSKSPTTKANPACTEAARAAAKAAAAKATGAATTEAHSTTTEGTTVTGKAGSASVPAAKKAATRSNPARTVTKPAAPAPAPQPAGAAHDATDGHAH